MQEFSDDSSIEDEILQNSYEQFRFEVDKGQELMRIDKFLMDRIENATRVKIQEAIDSCKVMVNNQLTKPSYKVKPGDVITVITFEVPRSIEIIPENIPLDILYEDEDIAIINKKPGMVAHPGFGNYTGTLVNALAWHFNQTGPLGTVRPWLVHRIDKDTSGLLVVAKNEISHYRLSVQFKNHTISRLYNALVWGVFAEDEGTITGNIARSESNRKLFRVYSDPGIGKHAITHYKVLQNLSFVSLIECRLETGRTHQIRVHLKHIGHTIFNDSFYGGHKILKGVVFSKYKKFVENCFQILPRQALHAKTLGFEHPVSGKQMFFDSQLPDDFKGALEKWQNINETLSLDV